MPDRPVLYLLPGLLCDRVTWAHQEAGLADLADIRIPSFYGFDALDAMARAVLAEAPPRFALAGHSMGARVALQIMTLEPGRVTHLALLDTGIHPVRPGEPEKRQVLVDLARTEGMQALAAAWLPPMVHPDAARDPALMRTLTDMVCRATPAIFAGQINALLTRPDFEAHMPDIRCPTLVGVGREDAWSPVSQHEPIAAAIPGAQLVVFENCGHMAPMEAPEVVTRALRTWLT